MRLPKTERKVIARTAAEVVEFAADKAPHLAGRRRFAIARAEGMRRLKASGMPQELARTMAPHIQPDPVEDDDDARELSQDELSQTVGGALSYAVPLQIALRPIIPPSALRW